MNKVLRIAVPVPLQQSFDYLPPEESDLANVKPGVRVKIPFGKRELVGILLEVSAGPQIKDMRLKAAFAILDEEPILPEQLLRLAQWASDYYHHPLGEVLASALPVLLRKGKLPTARLKAKQKMVIAEAVVSHLVLNSEQEHAITQIVAQRDTFQAFLLNGVTGSGKTEVYLQIIAKVLQDGKQVLLLVPEIGLTPQTVARFRERFNVPVAALHSGLTERERLDTWAMAKNGEIPIIIGTRSALFTPLRRPGMIIIDEEHDASFKQQEGFQYCARDLAVMRAHLENIPIVLGSATPSLESFFNVKQGRYHLLPLSVRAGSAVQPHFRLIDIRQQKLENGLSPQLLASMRQHLQQNGQILLFLNRRGFAPILLCHACGWMAACKRCDVKLTYHQQPAYLLCHHCGATQSIPQACPTCFTTQLLPLGHGTQRLEQTLLKHFPDVGIVRIDRDSTRKKGELQTILQDIHSGEKRILIGTQMLAKGHHFPDVTLVAVLDADSGLFSADFRAAEHTAQLLVQVAGRAGRAERPGEVCVQTHNPQHPLLLHLITEGYTSFVDIALAERALAELPPYSYHAIIRAEAVDKKHPTQFLTEVGQLAKQLQKPTVEILGPVPAIMERRQGRYRAQLLLQAKQRRALHELLKKLKLQITTLPTAKRVRWSLDVDPREMV